MTIHNVSSTKSTNHTAWFLCAITAIFYCFVYILRLLPGVLKDDLMLKYGITASDFGQFSGIYYAGYALFHLPFGIMLERVGPKSTIILSLLLCGAGIIPPLYFDSWFLAVLGRFLLGAGSSTAILALFLVIRTHFPPERFSSIFGMCVTLGLMGALFGSRPVGILNESIGCQNTLYIFVATTILLVAVFLVFMPTTASSTNAQNSSILEDLLTLMKQKGMWAVAILSGLMMGPIEGFADAWGVPFFQHVLNIDNSNAQVLPSFIFLGFAAGCPLLGYLGEKYQRPYTVMIISALFMALIYVILFIFKPQSLIILYTLMVITGILCGYQVFMIFINTRIVPKHLAGLSSTFTNMVAMSFGTFFHIIIGGVINLRWDGAMRNNLPFYTDTDYIYGLSIIPIGLMVGVVGFLYLKPKDESGLFKPN